VSETSTGPNDQREAELDVAQAAVASEEAALVARVQRGDTAAFDVLVRRYLDRAYRVAYRLLQHREDAEDLVQDSFLRALDKIALCAPGRPFGPWFFRILVTQGMNARRRRTLRDMAPLTDAEPSNTDSPAMDAERSDDRHRIRSALAGLPKQQRLIVQLADIEGFSSLEIAAMLELAAGTVRWHLHHARAALRDVLVPSTGEAS
jgi:RNA polymerase sigma-70 factor (ECF subfamily)